MTGALVVMFLVLGSAGPDGAAAGAPNTGHATAIFAQPLHDAQWVRGDDGMDHVEYDLLVVNAFDSPVTLTNVTALGPGGKTLATIEGAQLTAATQTLYDKSPSATVATSGAVTIDVDVAVTPGTVPRRIGNRIEYKLSPDTRSAPIVGSLEIDGPTVPVDRARPIVIRPPLRGDGWVATTSCCTPNLHRSLRLAVDGGRIETGEVFAVDWGRAKGDRLYAGDGTRNEDHYAYGADVLAVHDGKVVAVQDGKPEQTPYHSQPAQQVSDFGGNKVILEIAPRMYAAYEHLATGTVAVKVGDTVKAGDVIAKLGNTGPSEGAHLHFGLLDQPDVVTGRSLPFVIDRYTLAGTIDLAASEADHLVITPASKKIRNAFPLTGGIQNFR
jgi:hypothetical protein